MMAKTRITPNPFKANTTPAPAVYDIAVEAELLDHSEHLPEVISCSCGYVRRSENGGWILQDGQWTCPL